MHEFSLAEAMVELTARKVPHGLLVRSVTVRAGPMRAIEPEAMQWAWHAAVNDRFPGAELRLELLPWTLRCADCDKSWSADDPSQPCSCGSRRVYPKGSDELTLQSIEVEACETESPLALREPGAEPCRSP